MTEMGKKIVLIWSITVFHNRFRSAVVFFFFFPSSSFFFNFDVILLVGSVLVDNLLGFSGVAWPVQLWVALRCWRECEQTERPSQWGLG